MEVKTTIRKPFFFVQIVLADEEAPEMSPNNKEMTITAGAELTMYCKSLEKIAWRLPWNNDDVSSIKSS